MVQDVEETLAAEQEEKRHLQRMLDAGIIQPSVSEWASAPVLVKKRDAFHNQINIAEEDRKKTAFITKYRLFEFKKMAFGLCNVPATYARVMNLVLRELNWETVLAFLDDFLVLGDSFQSHLSNLVQRKQIEWGDKHQKASTAIKTALTTVLVLGLPNGYDSFILDTDASDWAIGTELLQVQEKQEKWSEDSNLAVFPWDPGDDGRREPAETLDKEEDAIAPEAVSVKIITRTTADRLGLHLLELQKQTERDMDMRMFTKWIECVPLPSQTAEDTARAALDGFFTRFGYPFEIFTDQGMNFQSDLFTKLCELMHIHKARTTACRPSANGQVERYNRTIMDALRCYPSSQHDSWDTYIQHIAGAIRSSVNRPTGFIPNKLMLGRETNQPIDLMFSREVQPQSDAVPYLANLQKEIAKAHGLARKSLSTNQERMKRDYDLQARLQVYERDDLVYLLDTAQVKGQCRKLSPQWKSPGIIIHKFSSCLCMAKLQNDKAQRITID
ncbi:uncharacterized protein [Procambarus clarkii]|uniref:uncharacterized protein n=1 Tax=Procambarus clarkii TaxID=6728 RepID=UPI00374270E2